VRVSVGLLVPAGLVLACGLVWGGARGVVLAPEEGAIGWAVVPRVAPSDRYLDLGAESEEVEVFTGYLPPPHSWQTEKAGVRSKVDETRYVDLGALPVRLSSSSKIVGREP